MCSSDLDRLSAAVREGSSLTDAARAEGLTLERPDWLRRNPRGYLEGLGSAPEVLTAAFALEPGPTSSDRIFEVEDKLVLVELLERRDVDESPASLETERERLLGERRDQARSIWMRDARQRLTDAGELRVDLSALQQS